MAPRQVQYREARQDLASDNGQSQEHVPPK